MANVTLRSRVICTTSTDGVVVLDINFDFHYPDQFTGIKDYFIVGAMNGYGDWMSRDIQMIDNDNMMIVYNSNEKI